jgi:hypothetical protein
MNEMKTAHVHPQGGATRKEADTLSEGLFRMMYTHTHVSKKGVGRCFFFSFPNFSEFGIQLFNSFAKMKRNKNMKTKKSKKIKTPCISPFQENRPTIN